MRSLEQILNDISKIPYHDTFGTKKEIKYLPNILDDNETVLSFTSGFFDGNTWLIVLTHRRLIFLDKGMIYGLKQREIPLDHINSVGHKIGLMLGSIAIQDGASAIRIDNIQKQTIVPFIDALNKSIDNFKMGRSTCKEYSSMSSADEIKKYKQLLDEGIITNEEFNIKKKQILGL